MPDLPISGLPQATTPLDGTEEYAIVQSGVTKRISSENITDIIVATNNYLTPVSLTCQDGVNIDLTGATNEEFDPIKTLSEIFVFDFFIPS